MREYSKEGVQKQLSGKRRVKIEKNKKEKSSIQSAVSSFEQSTLVCYANEQLLLHELYDLALDWNYV